jgi:capsular exopolysaccharide synthesis family protein
MKNSSSREKIGWANVRRNLRRRWYWFILAVALSLAGAYLYLQFTPKVYNLTATLLVEEPVSISTGAPGLVDDEKNLLTSFRRIRTALEGLQFQISYFNTHLLLPREEYSDLPFRVVLDSTQQQTVGLRVYVKMIDEQLYRLKAHGRNVPLFDLRTDRQVAVIPEVAVDKVLRVGRPYRDPQLGFQIDFLKKPGQFDPEGRFFVVNSLAGRAAEYQRRLRVRPLGEGSRTLEISIRGTLPDKEAAFLNELLRVHLREDQERQNQQHRDVIAWIDRQLGLDGGQASPKDRDPVLAEALPQPLPGEGLPGALLAERERVNNRVLLYEGLLQSLKRENEMIALPVTLPDTALQHRLARYNDLLRQREDLQLSKAPAGQVSKVNAQIQKTRVGLVEYTGSLSNRARQRTLLLDRSIAKVSLPQNALPTTPLPEVRRKLKLDDQVYRNVHDYLLTRRAEAGMALATGRTNKVIVDEARPVDLRPVYPDAPLVYAVAALLGLFLPLSLLTIRHFMRNRIINQTDIQLNTAIPTLGVVGYNDKASNYLVAYSSKSALAESFRSLRVNLQYLFLDSGKKVIGITSSGQGEGKTFCASNLSVVMAQSGKKTLLIDADLRKPRIAARFDVDNAAGLASYLTGAHKADDIIQVTATENLHIIPSGPLPASPLNLLGTPRMEALIEKVRQEYDYIILDTPPLGLVSDFLVLLKYTDFNMYIVRHRLTERAGLNKINELYNSNRLRNVGILINGARALSAYGYSDKTYKYGYGD